MYKRQGTFDVIIKDVYSPKGVRAVQVPTWSDKEGQDDLRWYEAARQANGDYKVSVKASDHKNSTGKYHVHLYYIQNDGSRIGIGTTTTDVEFRNATTKTQAAIKNVNATNGTYTVAVDQAPQGRQIKNIRVAAWSKAHQENLYWYSATPTGMHTEITVSANNHGNEVGNYTTHVYVDYKDGGVEGFNLGQTALSPRNQKVNPQTTYYSQRDPRWAGKYYGVSNVDQSGCVPTSLAMTFTDILGRTILPTTVADYLYNNTDSFNKGEAGTDSDGIVAATRNWGLKSQLINGAGGIAEALMAGKHVLAAVGNSQFTSDPYTCLLYTSYFNDDMYLIRESQPSDFYKKGQPKLLAVYDALVPWSPFTNTYHNNVELIYRHFPNKKALKSSPWKFFNFRYGSLVLKNLLLLPWGPTGYVNQHLPVPMKKSTLAHLWEIEGETLDKTSRNQIRDYGVDVNQYICQLWQIESNQFFPMSKNFGVSIDLNQVDRLESIFKDKRKKLLCVNDDIDFKEESIIRFKEILKEHYPEKSAFEK